MTVAAYGTSGLLQATAPTDSSGRYSLDSLPSGEFRLLAYDKAGVYATTFAGNAESFETSQTVSGDRTGYDFALVKGGTASGNVSGNSGGSLTGITVAAYNLSGTRRAFTATNGSGGYALVLPPGTYKLVAFDDSGVYSSSFYSDQVSFPSANPVVIESQRTRTVDLHLRLAAHISGVVTDAQSHLPLLGFLVSAYTTEGNLVSSTVSDSSGRYQLNVPDGTFRLLAADPRQVYATGYFAGANSFAQTPGLTLAPGELRADVALEAEIGGVVSGRVTTVGSATCCITVVAYNPDGSQRGTTRTDLTGGYQLVLPPGDFRIGAYDEGLRYAPQFYVSSATFHSATPVSVLRSLITGPVDLSLDLAARVTGQVSDSLTGTAIASIMVSAYDAGGNLTASATTNDSGSYALGLAAGTYRFVAFDPSLRYATAYPQLATTFEESPAYDLLVGASRSVDFALSKGTRVTGTVVDPSRTALSGIEIGALSMNGNRVATATTHGGTFDLVLPPGSYKLVAIDPRGRYFTLYFNSSGTFANATTVVVTGFGSTPGTLNFILPPLVRRRSAAH